MIISYEHKYIFWKPTKVAGSSILHALGLSSGKHDIVGQPQNKTTFEKLPGGGQGKNQQLFSMKLNARWDNHCPPQKIRKYVSYTEWDSFFKFTIVRNPWDEWVSRFYFKNKNLHKLDISDEDFPRIKKRFHQFLENSRINGPLNHNYNYYFNHKGELLADYYIKFENLEKDYQTVCEKLDIPCQQLPTLKMGLRKCKRSVSEYYSDEDANLIFKYHQQRVKAFDYTLGDII